MRTMKLCVLLLCRKWTVVNVLGLVATPRSRAHPEGAASDYLTVQYLFTI